MKSAEAFVKALASGLTTDEALASLPPYYLPYREGIPTEIYYAAQQLGWRFFPLPFKTGTAPLLINQATNRITKLKLWSRGHCNWGLATGSVSGVFVLAVEGEVGLESLLCACGDDWDWLDTLRSGAGETRYNFFTLPAEQCQITCGYIGKGLRILGDGDWVPMPPSRQNGLPYVYLNPHFAIHSAPLWMVNCALHASVSVRSIACANSGQPSRGMNVRSVA